MVNLFSCLEVVVTLLYKYGDTYMCTNADSEVKQVIAAKTHASTWSTQICFTLGEVPSAHARKLSLSFYHSLKLFLSLSTSSSNTLYVCLCIQTTAALIETMLGLFSLPDAFTTSNNFPVCKHTVVHLCV